MRTPPSLKKRALVLAACGGLAVVSLLATCGRSRSTAMVDTQAPVSGGGGNQGIDAIMKARGLTPDEAEAALKTFVPPGRHDDFIMFASGGHRGSVLLFGLPSMRLLKEIPVYAPDAWQGWGQGSTEADDILAKGSYAEGLPTLTWGDLHHPQISLTNGKYDGEWLAVSDKSAGRVAIISLRDFKTKSIFKTPNSTSDHHAVWSDDSEWLIQNSFFPIPLGQPRDYAPLEEYQQKFRGTASFLKFDRAHARISVEDSFQIELPPYFQDMSTLGRGASDGWYFVNSINTEMTTGGTLENKPAMEIGASAREMDYLHVINWKKAAEIAKDPAKVRVINGVRVIPLETAVNEGLLYLVPESKSPHGIDLAPGGEYLLVAGKLDPHVTAFSFAKIQQAITGKKVEGKDPYGIPILDYDACVEAYIEVGLGPLHNVFDDKGFGYTSLFLDSAVAKYTLGPPYNPPDKAWKVVDKISVHYNIGHLQAPGSNTRSPYGKYLVALNKWSVDRHPLMGPLHPQNLQLIDVSGDKMKLLSDTPTIGEPHNSMIMPVELLQAWAIYEPGFSPATMSTSPDAVEQGKESVRREGNTVHVHGTVIRSHYTPDIVRVKQGDRVVFHWTNVESARDGTHGFGLHGYNVALSIDPGATESAEIVATRPGVYPWYCTEFCSALHMEMTGWMIVEPQ